MRTIGSRTGMLTLIAAGMGVLMAPSPTLGQGAGAEGQDGQRQRGGERQPQRGMGGFAGGMRGFFGAGGDPMSPSIDSREIERYAGTLGLTAEQQELARALFEGYQEQFRTRAGEAREKMERARAEARESGDPSMWRTLGTGMQEFRRERQKMEEEFFSDYKAILTPEQAAQWPVVERTRRREKTISRGLMSGERLDVIKLVDRADLPPDVEAALAPVLAQYELDLDRELVSRNKVYDEGMASMLEMRGDPTQAPEELQKMMERAREASVKVRDLNRRYARQVESALPEDQRGAWARTVKEASFPDIYRPTNSSRLMAAAEGFADLDDTQREGVDALRATYSRELDAVNERLAAAQEQMEMTVTAQGLLRRRFGGGGGGGGGGGAGDGPADPVAEARQQKRDLDRRTTESLHKLLTPGQVERLPDPERRGDRPRGGDGAEGRDGDERPPARRRGG